MKQKGKKDRLGLYLAVTFVTLAILMGGSVFILYDNKSPLPDAWNPTKPLVVTEPVTLLTRWKLRRATSSPETCLAVLGSYAEIQSSPTRQSENPACFITTPVQIRRVGEARMSGIETDCPTALRLAMWEHHDVQPAAQEAFGARVTAIRDIGSFNCRAIRTTAGDSARMSAHATASAIDIIGFRFSDGQSLTLTNDWNANADASYFFRTARDGACRWFPQTLSPDYNELHNDHFHLQVDGWRVCE